MIKVVKVLKLLWRNVWTLLSSAWTRLLFRANGVKCGRGSASCVLRLVSCGAFGERTLPERPGSRPLSDAIPMRRGSCGRSSDS